jgi:hypothetical protein
VLVEALHDLHRHKGLLFYPVPVGLGHRLDPQRAVGLRPGDLHVQLGSQKHHPERPPDSWPPCAGAICSWNLLGIVLILFSSPLIR